MDTQGLVIVFGSLAVVIGMIVFGAFIGGQWGRTLLAVGVLGVIAWVLGALWLANAMNTDI